MAAAVAIQVVSGKSVTIIQVEPLGRSASILACFYNHARRRRLKKLFYLELFLEVPTDIYNHLWLQAAVSFLYL